MLIQRQPKDKQVESPTLFGLDIFAEYDTEHPRMWLRTVLLPVLVNARYLESKGFKASFVRRFDKKHSRVLRFDGTVARQVRGVNELEFLRGVADALGIRSFEDPWDPRDTVTTTAVARKCLEAFAALESRRREADSTGRTPEVAPPTITSLAGAQS